MRGLCSTSGKGGPFGWWSDDSGDDESSKKNEDPGADGDENEKSNKRRKRKSRGSSLLRTRRSGATSGISFNSSDPVASDEDVEDESVEDGGSASSSSSGSSSSLNPDASKGQLVYSKAPFLPEVLLVPFKNRPIFPPYTVPMQITQEPLIDALETVRTSATPYVALFLEKDLTEEEQDAVVRPPVTADAFHEIGTFAQVLKVQENKQMETDGEQKTKSWTVMLRVHRRVQLLDVVEAGPPITAKIEHLSEKPVEFYNQVSVWMRVLWVRSDGDEGDGWFVDCMGLEWSGAYCFWLSGWC